MELKTIPIEIITSTLSHARELVKTLREKDRREAEGLGLEPHKGIFQAYKKACYKKTVLVDEEVAAMFGLHGELLGTVGRPYLITGTAVEKVSPLTFARIYTKEAMIMKELFPVLENIVDANYHEAVRMLKIAGFTVSDEAFEFTPGRWFRKFSMVA